MVGAGCDDCCACGALAGVLEAPEPWPRAKMERVRTDRRRKVLMNFIAAAPLDQEESLARDGKNCHCRRPLAFGMNFARQIELRLVAAVQLEPRSQQQS